MKKISLVACGVLLSSSMAFGANTIDSAFKEGKVSGSLALYGQSIDNKSTSDEAFSSGAVSLAFETASLYGFSAKAGFIGVHVFDEKNDTDADIIASKALMTEAYGQYSNDAVTVMVGRQAIDLEWMGDFHEAAVVAVTAIPDTTIVLGYTQKMAVAGVDEVSERFEKVNGDKGAYVLDVKYAGLESVEFNPYAYSAPDLADWYGLKATFTADMFGAVAHYAASNEDVVGTEDGSIGHLELNTTISDFTAALGYIKTDKDGGAGNMYAVGDNISPFEDGNYVYDLDARTVYGSVGYSIAGVDLGALYGQTKYVDDKEKELNLTVGYSFTESLAASLLYADIDANSSSDDYNKVLASVEYTF